MAGTVTTLKALELGLVPYDGGRVHGAALTLSAIEQLRSGVRFGLLERLMPDRRQ